MSESNKLQPLAGETFDNESSSTEDEFRLKIRANFTRRLEILPNDFDAKIFTLSPSHDLIIQEKGKNDVVKSVLYNLYIISHQILKIPNTFQSCQKI